MISLCRTFKALFGSAASTDGFDYLAVDIVVFDSRSGSRG